MAYDVVVFDMDGVLVEPTDARALQRAVRRAFEEFGLGDPTEAEMELLYKVANTTEEDLQRICDEHGIDPAEFWRIRESYAAEEQLATVEDGDKTLYDDLDVLAELDARLGVVSNNQHETVEGVLERDGWDELFEAARGRPPTIEGVRHKKPDPRYLEEVVAALGGTEPLFVGDSNADLIAADRAGIDAAYLRRPHREGYELRRDPAHRIASLPELREIV